MKKDKRKKCEKLLHNAESAVEIKPVKKQLRTISLLPNASLTNDTPQIQSLSSTLSLSESNEKSKNSFTAKIVEFPEKPYSNRVSIEQLKAIWNDEEETYNDAELLVIRDWLYTIAEVVTEVINSPGFIPPQIMETNAVARKARQFYLPPPQSKSTSINMPQYKEAKTAS